jgi:hypothetical protein
MMQGWARPSCLQQHLHAHAHAHVHAHAHTSTSMLLPTSCCLPT